MLRPPEIVLPASACGATWFAPAGAAAVAAIVEQGILPHIVSFLRSSVEIRDSLHPKNWDLVGYHFRLL